MYLSWHILQNRTKKGAICDFVSLLVQNQRMYKQRCKLKKREI